MRGILISICLLGCLVGLHLVRANYDDVNMYDDYDVFSAGYDEQYDDYAEDADGDFIDYPEGQDEYDGDYAFDDPDEVFDDCRIGEKDKPTFNGTVACDVKLTGADQVLKGMAGGIDGVYVVHSCENGRPMYLRKDSKPGEERLLWFSSEYRDWDLTNGTVANSDNILLFGGNSEPYENRPQLVSSWSMATEFLKDYKGEEEYAAIDLQVVCADGSKTAMPAFEKYGKRPMLTDDEMEAQYKMVYTKAARHSSAEVNLGMVTLFVMIGLGIVFGLPFMVARNRRMRKRPGSAAAEGPLAGIASILDINRKRDHTN